MQEIRSKDRYDRPRSYGFALGTLVERVGNDARLTSDEKLVLIMLATHAKTGQGTAYPSQKTLAAMTGICISNVGKALKGLEQKLYLLKEDRFNRDGGRSTCLYDIRHMRFYPSDAPSSKDGVPTRAAPPSVPDTDTHRAGYRGNRLNLNKISLSSDVALNIVDHDQAEAEVDEREILHVDEVEELRSDRGDVLGKVRDSRQLLAELRATTGYLIRNRATLVADDMLRIAHFRRKIAGIGWMHETVAKASPSEVQARLSAFFDDKKRAGKMNKPNAATLATLRDELVDAVPACFMPQAFEEIDRIYLDHYRKPPKLWNFLKAIDADLKELAEFRKVVLAAEKQFADCEKLYQARRGPAEEDDIEAFSGRRLAAAETPPSRRWSRPQEMVRSSCTAMVL